MNDCIIGIGSNIEAKYHIQEMLRLLAADVEIVRVSDMVQTKPIGITEQADYTNGAVRIRTEMEMEVLSHYLKNLEDQMGRDRTQKKYGPRNIDLDILIWNDEIVDPDYFTREFLRNSAAELGYEHKT
ncbi:MAG TPA: 2-amino-4-hydroxy-6-hydroxymethyldihydropteridine diphosphokinase [Prolixibacteraceae bacterium]|nr:MAG: 2-amino-4-hydroxy-6-hydroxymethyldihydropteridine diphosphokinase [Bacteroidetes bacterium GWB2_41_8]HCY43697.1 2-amino-4-hydroxy-6-hydroxymethyldihydropteridine diphosphokinase [Prolixibacteraceae bacterium]